MIDKFFQEEDRRFEKEAKRVQRFAERSQLRVYLVLTAVAFFPLLSFLLYFNSAKSALDDRLYELTTTIAKAAVSHIDADSLALVMAGAGPGSAAYNLQANRLNILLSNVEQIDRLVTLAIIDDELFTLMAVARDAQAPGGQPNTVTSEYMQRYSSEDAGALTSYRTRMSDADIASSAPFSRESAGTIHNCLPLSAGPAANPALLCADITPADYFSQRDRMRNGFALASLLILTVSLFIFYSVMQHQRQVRLAMSLLRRQRDYFLKSSRTDALTGIMNRRAFQRAYAVAEAQSNRNSVPFAVISIDIDNFKVINDTYGHDRGDQVLITVARELSRVLRKNDVLARMGGEEFCVLCALNEAGQAFIVAEKLRSAVEAIRIPLPDERFIALTISLGIHNAHPEQSMEEVLKAADVALYIAKAGGRNRSVFYTKDMESNVKDTDLNKPSTVDSEKRLDWAN